jgi:hypothetical protein
MEDDAMFNDNDKGYLPSMSGNGIGYANVGDIVAYFFESEDDYYFALLGEW